MTAYNLFLDELEAVVDFPVLAQNKKEELIAEANNEAKNFSSTKNLIKFIDLTTLLGDDTKSKVERLVRTATQPIKTEPEIMCASVCVYPARIFDACNAIKSSGRGIAVASVAAGFPSGQYHIESRLLEIELAVRDGANEIDAVINRAAVLDGDWGLLFDEIFRMKRAAGSAKLKMILAVGELANSENIYKASMVAMFAGADFIKTSTGKEVSNATLDSALIMCTAISNFFNKTGRRVGFKAAGGIRTLEQALRYKLLVEQVLGSDWLTPELFRIGASGGLLDDVVSKMLVNW